MTTEDEIRRVLHPEAHEPMPYNPRLPLGCDQQGRYPEAADVRIDDDEIRDPEPPQRDPWWHDVVLLAVGVLLMVAIFAPLGVR
jgi:hypothetical protein